MISIILQIQQLSESLIVKFDGYMHRLGNAHVQLDEGYATVASASKAMDAAARQQFECVAQLTDLHGEMVKSLQNYNFTETFVALLLTLFTMLMIVIALVIAAALVAQLWEFITAVWKEARFYNEV